jgi:hypothetical protein
MFVYFVNLRYRACRRKLTDRLSGDSSDESVSRTASTGLAPRAGCLQVPARDRLELSSPTAALLHCQLQCCRLCRAAGCSGDHNRVCATRGPGRGRTTAIASATFPPAPQANTPEYDPSEHQQPSPALSVQSDGYQHSSNHHHQ